VPHTPCSQDTSTSTPCISRAKGRLLVLDL